MNKLLSFNQALSDETRWRIIQLLLRDALCVCEMADILKMPQSSVSSHVQVIRRAGLLDSERLEKWVYYKVGAHHRYLLLEIANFFEVSPATNSVLRADAKNTAKRLAKREASFSPRPQHLAS